MKTIPIPEVTVQRRKVVPKLLEAQIQQTCVEFLALDGWRRIRTDLKHLRGMGVQEPGMADDAFIRYGRSFCSGGDGKVRYLHCPAEVMWVEWKRERGGRGLYTKAEKAKIHQQSWHAGERARGAMTLIAGEDFPASIEGFQEWYFNSGLARKLRAEKREGAAR